MSEIEIERLKTALRAIISISDSKVRGAIGLAGDVAQAALDGVPLPNWRGEEWRPIPGFDEYEASSHGRIRRRLNRILKQTPTDKYGHHLVTIYTKGLKKQKHRTGVHRLVALAFLGPSPPGKPYALHRDGVAWNSVPGNLYWGDHDDNTSDRIRHASLRTRGKNGESLSDAA